MQHHRKGQDGAFWERLIDQSSTRLGRVCRLFFLSFLFLSQVNLEITQHVNFVRCRKPWKSQGWIPTAFPNLTKLSQFRLVFLLLIVQVLPWIQGFEAKDQVLL